MILHCIFRLFNVVLKFYYCIFIRLFKCNSSGKFLMQINFLRYRAPMETSLRAEWASLCKSSFTLLYFKCWEKFYCQYCTSFQNVIAVLPQFRISCFQLFASVAAIE